MRSLFVPPLALSMTASIACAAPPPEYEAPALLIPDLGAPSPWDDLPEPDRAPSRPPGMSDGDPTPEGSGGESSAEDPPVDLQDLRLTEVLADPEGKDGDPWSPEIVELMNVGDEALPLAELTILARGWPRLRTDALDLAEEHLGPGERLVLYRYAELDEAPWAGVFYEPGILEVHFDTASGLRNGDGAVILLGAGDEPLDALIYGAEPPTSHDFEGAWTGAPLGAPESGWSWSRWHPSEDTDSAEDWIMQPPSPGEIVEESGSGTATESEGDTESSWGDDTGDTAETTDGTTGGTLDGESQLVITEVLSNAPGPSAQERELEYVEILNLGPDDVDLAGWSIADSEDINAPGRDPLHYREGSSGCQPESCLAAGARALVVGGAFIGPTGGAMVFETDDTNLADGGLTAHEPVVLRDWEDAVASTYRVWPDAFAEPYPVDIELPVHRLSPEAEDTPGAWILEEASPGVP